MRNVKDNRGRGIPGMLADLNDIEAAHIARIQARALALYGALGQLVACLEDFARHGSRETARELTGALEVANAELGVVEGRTE